MPDEKLRKFPRSVSDLLFVNRSRSLLMLFFNGYVSVPEGKHLLRIKHRNG